MVREAHLKFTRDLPETLTIRSVDADGIRINDQVWSETLALTPQKIFEHWKPVPIADLIEDDFSELLAESPEVVILGTGAKGRIGAGNDNAADVRVLVRRHEVRV